MPSQYMNTHVNTVNTLVQKSMLRHVAIYRNKIKHFFLRQNTTFECNVIELETNFPFCGETRKTGTGDLENTTR